MTPSWGGWGPTSGEVPTSTPTHRVARGFPLRVVRTLHPSRRVTGPRSCVGGETLSDFSGLAWVNDGSGAHEPHPVEHPRLDERPLPPRAVATRNPAVAGRHLGLEQHVGPTTLVRRGRAQPG